MKTKITVNIPVTVEVELEWWPEEKGEKERPFARQPKTEESFEVLKFEQFDLLTLDDVWHAIDEELQTISTEQWQEQLKKYGEYGG